MKSYRPSKQMSTEFVKQSLRDNLTRTLIPHIADGLWSVYDNAKSACERNGQPEKTLQTFQNLLTRIPQWNVETLDKEVDRIAIASKCDYIEDLLLGVFVSYIRAFASLQQRCPWRGRCRLHRKRRLQLRRALWYCGHLLQKR